MAKKNSIFKQHSIIGKKGMMKNQTHSPTYIVRFLSPRSDTSENQENNDNNQNYINNKQGQPKQLSKNLTVGDIDTLLNSIVSFFLIQ